MNKYRAKKTCYWGPQPGAESLVLKDEIVFAHGNEPHLGEFFILVEADPVIAPKPEPAPAVTEPGPPLGRGKKPLTAKAKKALVEDNPLG